MPKVTITGVDSRIDGSYELDLEDVFTGNELHLIKKHSGVRVAEIAEAMTAGDYDLIVCLTKIAMDRAGNDVPIELLMGAKVGAIQFEPSDAEKTIAEEEEALPPASAPTGATKTNSDRPSSGPPSETGSDSTPESDLLDTGSQALPTGSAYSLET
jgi:hypothetical protein